jgi:hypothetical protein
MRTRSAVSSATVNRSVPARRPSAAGRTGAAAPVAALTGVLILTLIALVPLAGTAPLLHFTGQAALVVAVLPAAWLLVRVVTAAVARLDTGRDAWSDAA